MKRCKWCAIEKPVSDFGKKSSQPDGLEPVCRECYRAKAASRRMNAPAIVAHPAGKLTTAATDYRPNREVVATFAAIQMMTANGETGPNMLFLGPSGSGKTEAARDLARRSQLPFFKVDAPAITDPEAWFGTRELVVESGAPKTVFSPSLFVTALGQKCILLIDEGNRVSDAIRNILLALLDGSRAVTNPLTGQVIDRHPECYIVITGNAGLAFTGTYAIDPAFYTRCVTTKFDYLAGPEEQALAQSRTGCTAEVAELFVRFANETRQRAVQSEDFPPVSTREVLTACALVAKGLDANVAVHQVMINAAPADGGPESIQGQMELIWAGIRKVAVETDDDHDASEPPF